MSEQNQVEEVKFSNIPPLAEKFQRNEFGLLANTNYEFTEDGYVNWRKMIKPEYLVFNLQKKETIEKQYGKPLSELSVNDVDDKFLLILLSGIKELANLRGFDSVTYEVDALTEGFVSAVCRIQWSPNYEAENRVVVFEDGADATLNNTSGFGSQFLTTIAINRAFVRAVRNFLKIHIVGNDEVNKAASPEEDTDNQGLNTSPVTSLEAIMQKKNVSLEKLKKHCSSKGDDVSGWNTVNDIPKAKIFELIGRLNKIKEK